MSKQTYDKTNTGVLFRQDKKGNPKRPGYTGIINVEGVDYRIAAWVRENSKTGTLVSLRIERPKEAGEQMPAEPQATQEFESDDIPF